ncbi:MAG: ECF-type sigma factor [Pirellulales bacterium]
MTEWITALMEGSDEAAQRLWGRYFDRMCRVVQGYLHGAGCQVSAGFDAEQVALDSFRRFCAAHQEGRFPELQNRDGLWPLLVTITLNRTRDELRSEGAQKRRSDQRTFLESELKFAAGEDSEFASLDQIPGRMPPTDLAAEMAERCREMLDMLEDPELRQVALWRLDGLTNDEIATRLGFSRRTVQRMLLVIRSIWENHLQGPDSRS